jgi:hypothetical protein
MVPILSWWVSAKAASALPSASSPAGHHRCRQQARQAGVVAGGLGVPGAGQHAARHGGQRENVSRLHDVRRYRVGRHGGLHGAGPVGGGNAGINTLGGLDRQGEIGFLPPRLGHHRRQVQLATALLGHRQAHQPAGLARHEVDMRGIAVLRRHHHHPLVVVLGGIVQQHHHAALADIADQFIDGIDVHAVSCGPFMRTTLAAQKAVLGQGIE